MSLSPRPICYGCKHFLKPFRNFKCEAFPKGIPDEILDNEADHRKPVGEDNGIRFEARTPEDESYARDLFRKSVAKGNPSEG